MSIKNEKLLNSNNYWSKPEFFLAPMEYRRFQIGCVFKPYIFIHNLIYVSSPEVLRCQPIPPHFFFQVPLTLITIDHLWI